jgi:hypothetical protein
MNRSNALTALLLAAIAGLVQAANLSAPQTVQVTSISGSKSSAKGYFVFTTAAPVAGCQAGFWMPVDDVRYTGYLARVNNALTRGAPVVVTADLEAVGTGAALGACRVADLR